MATCSIHNIPLAHHRFPYVVYSCGGTEPGCERKAWPSDIEAPAGATCPGCDSELKRVGETPIEVGYCPECFLHGFPPQALPSCVTVPASGEGTAP